MVDDRLATIIVGSHFFKVREINYKLNGLLMEFCKLYTKYEIEQGGPQKGQLVPKKTYASIMKDFSEYRFHRNQLGHFFEFMKSRGVPQESFRVGKKADFTPATIKMDTQPHWELRGKQVDAVKFINSEMLDNSRFLGASPGSGKTFMSMYCLLKRRKRIAICVLPKYVEKWKEDVENIGDSKSIMVIDETNKLKGFIAMAMDTPERIPDVLIFSLITLRDWHKIFEEMKPEAESYGCHPEDLFRISGVGSVLVDESHENINSVWSLMLYTHVELLVGLSGTLMSTERFIEMIHRIMYPQNTRYEEIKMEKYIDLYPIAYNILHFKDQRLRTTAIGSNNYSHTEFEKSIRKNKRLLESYLEMIGFYVDLAYESRAKEGECCIVYGSTIEFCGILRDYFQKKYPHRTVMRYTGEEQKGPKKKKKEVYERFLAAEIKVSTPGMAGTAIDMPGLIGVVATNSIYSPVQNIQMLGRLRNLKDKELRFYYLYCKQIPKQVEYHKQRLELFESRTKKITPLIHHEDLIGMPGRDTAEYQMSKGGIPGHRYTPTRGVNQWRPSNNPWRAPPKRGFDSLSPGTHNRVRYGY